jgi:hypothetical protein
MRRQLGTLALAVIVAAGLLVGLPYAQDLGVQPVPPSAPVSERADVEDSGATGELVALGSRDRGVAVKHSGATRAMAPACQLATAAPPQAFPEQRETLVFLSVIRLPLRC